jgi:hypothetical protein
MAKNAPRKIAGKERATAAARKRSTRKAVRSAKKASIALRSSIALAHATPLFADLHDRIQNFVLDDLKDYQDAPDPTKPIPDPLFKEPVLEILLGKLREAFASDPSWGVNSTKFHLTAKQLMNLAKGKSLSYLIQIIYQRAHDALVS